MKRIGLTGGIASGKSTVSALLAQAGVPIIDADLLARQAVAPGSQALHDIRLRFGDGVFLPDGTLDRKALGAIVFGDADARLALNAIVHPQVFALAQAAFAAHEVQGAALVIYDAPLLFENHLDAMMDGSILVACSEDTQLKRLMQRDHIDATAARARIASQMPLHEKRERATWIIDNNGTVDTLAQAVAKTLAQVRASVVL